MIAPYATPANSPDRTIGLRFLFSEAAGYKPFAVPMNNFSAITGAASPLNAVTITVSGSSGDGTTNRSPWTEPLAASFTVQGGCRT